MLGRIAHEAARWDEARDLLEQAVSGTRAAGQPAAWPLCVLGQVAREQGDFATARARLGESLEAFRERGDRWSAAVALYHLGITETLAGDHEAAAHLLADALTLQWELRTQGQLAATLEGLAQTAAARGEPRRALGLAGAAAVLREALGTPPTTAERERLEQRLATARRALGKDEAEAALRAGRTTPLADVIADALSAARPAASRAAVARSRAPAASPADRLAPREREVAALVAQGLTNREIGERLIITTGTARIHVEHILAKLELRSRTELAAWAVASGLAAPPRA
jgi:DNA-binding CsgD family transcriptional regulator